MHDRKKNTLLIVDDDAMNIYSLSQYLLEYDYTVLTAASGSECLEILSKHSEIKIILLDIMMPEMNGHDVLKHIREHSPDQLIVIAVTAQARNKDREQCLASGFDDYISKPIDGDTLIDSIESFL